MGAIVVETFIRAPREICFDLALDVGVHQESAAFSRERLTPPGRMTGRLEAGDLLSFEGRHFGLRQKFTVRIVDVDRPRRFVDTMVGGIFASLDHVHEFVEERGGTLMRDQVSWTTPGGALGAFADRILLERHMRRFVATKQAELARIIEARAR